MAMIRSFLETPVGGLSVGNPHHRRPMQRGAVRAERRTEHGPIARAAGPDGASAAAVAEASLMAHEHFAATRALPPLRCLV